MNRLLPRSPLQLRYQRPLPASSVTNRLSLLRDKRCSSQQVKMADRVHRITMFKAPKPEDQQKLLAEYKIVNAKAERNGAPYILSLTAGVAETDPRSNGFTVVAKTEFASLDDMKFYDNECKAHQALKAAAKDLTIEGIQTVYFTPEVVAEKQ
ncbi:hypothetical protein JDV02_009859 [Purpureocillium takamizusanense]|uniref:Stress-response A/B barrel domain-containing protein n=1 Tax=Purpureocillium takamizusanense TaxID=2060973 RepID=A0A9Q8QQX6_9HYPO|nr:uncharacterized protein JDV02_009859 [Purpureocillium takamizusanense]UNI24083.1 hypothetical protein JDV02_009859 [Purpureocillium takamizusanense]